MSTENQKKDGAFFRFFFQPSDPINLGVSRFLYYGIIFLLYVSMDFSSWGKMPDVLWNPIFLFDILPLPDPSPEVLGVLGYIWIVSIFFCSIGFLTRISTVVAFFIGLYLFGFINSFAKTSHVETLMLLIFAIMAISKCGDGFSADNLWRKYRSRNSDTSSHVSIEYSWPINLIKVMFVFVFCAAGLSKLRNSGFNWFTSDFLSSLLINKGFTGDRTEPVIEWLPFWLGNKPLLSKFLAGFALFLEIFAPLALFNRYLGVVIIPSLFLLVAGFWVVMGIPFPQLLASFVFWIPWDRFIKSGIIG